MEKPNGKSAIFSVHPMSIPNGVLVTLGPLWALQKCILSSVIWMGFIGEA